MSSSRVPTTGQLLQLNLRASTDFADGVSLNFDEPVDKGTKDITLDAALDLSGDIIDIKPADKNNRINVASSATVDVAIFSREGVDTTTIDPLTLTLRGLPGPGPIPCGSGSSPSGGAVIAR